MSVKVAAVTVQVSFEDSRVAVFSVSASGQIEPSQGDGVGCSAAHWVKGAELLVTQGLKAPDPSFSAQSQDGRICWPWAP